jgi:membrane-associated phospholipid phosphatase
LADVTGKRRPVQTSVATVLAAALVAALVGGAACGASPPMADSGILTEYVHSLYGAIRVERLSPPVAARLMGYATVAMHAAASAATPAIAPLEGSLRDAPTFPRSASPETVDAGAAVIAAERRVLDALLQEALPTTRASLGRLADSLVGSRRARGVTEGMLHRSDSLGALVAASVLAWAARDGFAATRGRPYMPPSGDSVWRNDNTASSYASTNVSSVSEDIMFDNPANQRRSGNVGDRAMILSRPKSARTLPPANMAGATEPYWHEVRTFVLERWDACPIAPPPAFTRDTTSTRFREAREVYDVRRADDAERATAFYWADNAGESGTPVGHWLSIASQLISSRAVPFDSAVVVLAAASIAQADAFSAAWGYKYRFLTVRPRHYIRATIDSQWEPLLPTPPFPEFPSGHSTQSSAAATVLARVLGDGAFADSTSVALGHPVRRYPSFQAASDEAGHSRILGGIHFPSGNTAGLALGRCIGERVAAAFAGARR